MCFGGTLSSFKSNYLNQKQVREEAEVKMQDLITLAQNTSVS